MKPLSASTLRLLGLVAISFTAYYSWASFTIGPVELRTYRGTPEGTPYDAWIRCDGGSGQYVTESGETMFFAESMIGAPPTPDPDPRCADEQSARQIRALGIAVAVLLLQEASVARLGKGKPRRHGTEAAPPMSAGPRGEAQPSAPDLTTSPQRLNVRIQHYGGQMVDEPQHTSRESIFELWLVFLCAGIPGLAVSTALVLGGLTGEELPRFLGSAAVGGAGVTCAAAARRQSAKGVYVSVDGIEGRSMTRTWHAKWGEVDSFTTEYESWHGWAERMQLRVLLKSGTSFPLPGWSWSPLDEQVPYAYRNPGGGRPRPEGRRMETVCRIGLATLEEMREQFGAVDTDAAQR